VRRTSDLCPPVNCLSDSSSER